MQPAEPSPDADPRPFLRRETVAWALLNHQDQLDDIASQIAPQAQLDETLVLRAARRSLSR